MSGLLRPSPSERRSWTDSCMFASISLIWGACRCPRWAAQPPKIPIRCTTDGIYRLSTHNPPFSFTTPRHAQGQACWQQGHTSAPRAAQTSGTQSCGLLGPQGRASSPGAPQHSGTLRPLQLPPWRWHRTRQPCRARWLLSPGTRLHDHAAVNAVLGHMLCKQLHQG